MNNLRIARKAAHLTQQEVAEAIGVSQSGYYYWETSKTRIDNDSLSKLADLFGCTTDYLLGKDNYPRALRIPVVGDVAAGVPIEAVENVVDYEEIDGALADQGEYFALRVRGTSMEPRIKENDVVIVRKQEDAETGDTVVVLVDGESATVKRIKKEPDGGLWLLPNNPAFEPQHYSPGERISKPVKVIGKVIELRAKF